MKRISLYMIILSVVLCLHGCMGIRKHKLSDSINYNFNNITANNSFFWITDEAMYYADSSFLTNNYYSVTNSGKIKIASADNGAFSKIQTHGDDVYMLDFSKNPDPETTTYRLHSYNAKNDSHKLIGYFDNILYYFVLEDNLYYVQSYFTETEYKRSLHVYDLAQKTDECINDSIISAGVSDDRVIYLTQSDDLFTVHQVADEPVELGQFNCPLGKNDEIAESLNCTSQWIMLTVHSGNRSKLLCYDLQSGELEECDAGGYIHSAIAYKDYAFLTVVRKFKADTDDQVNTIYRLCLEDGNLEEVAELNGLIDTFVTSDSYVYVSSTTKDGIYRYDMDGKKTLAYSI